MSAPLDKNFGDLRHLVSLGRTSGDVRHPCVDTIGWEPWWSSASGVGTIGENLCDLIHPMTVPSDRNLDDLWYRVLIPLDANLDDLRHPVSAPVDRILYDFRHRTGRSHD